MTETQNQQELAVVLGATGAIGSAVVRALVARNQPVRAITRNKTYAQQLFKDMNVEIVVADMLSLEQTKKAVMGAKNVYQCIGIPYTSWLKEFPLIQKNIIEAISGKDTLLIYADNLYMYGKMNGEKIAEDHPQNTTSKKGLLRKELAEDLLEFHQQGKVKVVIVRFADFYGPNVINGFTLQLFPNALAGKAANWVGDLDQKHSMIYIEDAAKGLVTAAEFPELQGKVWHVEGAEPVTGKEFIEMMNTELNQDSKAKVLKKGTIRFLSPFVPIIKELKELLDQWEYPFIIDGTNFRRITNVNGFTPHQEALKTTLQWFKENYRNKNS